MKSKIIKVVIACIVVVGVGVAGYIVYAKNTSKHMSFTATRYVTAAVSKQSISTTIQGTGTAYAATTEAITANNSGTISSLSVKVGDTVTAGQTLFLSSSDDVTKSVTTANNNLSKQKLTLSSDETALANAESKVTADNTAIAEAETALSTAKTNASAASISTSTSTSASSSSAQQSNSGIPQGNSGNQQSSNTQSVSAVDSVTAAQNKLTQLQASLKNDENSVKNYTNSIVTDKIAVSEAEADLTTAKANLSKVTVTSPIAGLVTAVNYSNGDSVQGTSSSSSSGTSSATGASTSSGSSSGSNSSMSSNSNSSSGTSSNSSTGSSSSVLTVVDMNSIKIKVSVDELDVSKIKVGQSATIKFDALSDKSFTGTVEEVPQTGTTSNNVTTYDVVVKVNNPSGIKLGMSANVAITIESKDNALVIPADALVEKNNKEYVKVQNTTSSNSTDLENSGNLVEIKTGIENLNYIEVTSGISEGQLVIYKSTSAIMPGNMGNMNNSSNSKAAASSGNSSSSKSNQ